MNRRDFLAGLALAPAAALAADPGSQSPGHDRKDNLNNAVLPPGAGTRANLLAHCTACGLCIAQCPHQVIVPVGNDYGPRGLMMPKLDFGHGFCDYHCHTCSHVCPAGALAPLAHDEKCRTKVGSAEYTPWHCVVEHDRVSCGICAEHCPTQAITMVRGADGRSRPVVDDAKCIGCGTCEYYCPAKPKAMRVKGLDAHTFVFGDLTLFALLPGHNRTWTSTARGLKPLFDALDGAADLRGAKCYDRIVGRAAAFLYAKLGVREVVAPVVAEGAVAILKSRGIAVQAGTVVPVIRNRTNTDMCPMEKSVLNLKDDRLDDADKTLRRTMAELRKQ